MRSFLKTNDFFLTKEPFELLYDESLDMLLTSPQPQDLKKYYNSTDYISHTDSNSGLLGRTYQKIKKWNLARKTSLLDEYKGTNANLLDIGAGTGDFLIASKEKGWNVFGVEPNKNARELAKKKNVVLEQSIEGLIGKKFQVITLWHVLEHLPDLERQIAVFAQFLTQDGALIVAVPNFHSFDANHYGKYWAAFDVPRHLWHFSKKSIALLFGKRGMEIKRINPMWFDSFYVALLSEQYKTGKRNWFKATMIGFWSNLHGIFTKEYSSHLYVLKKRK